MIPKGRVWIFIVLG
jgi:hypothetical protein